MLNDLDPKHKLWLRLIGEETGDEQIIKKRTLMGPCFLFFLNHDSFDDHVNETAQFLTATCVYV